MPICIYCGDDLDPAMFDREHVIPEQFGLFENNQTLLKTVCHGCNHYFSTDIERALGRGSLEAIFRLKYGQKAVADLDSLEQKRLTFRIPGSKPGFGVIVIPQRHPLDQDIILTFPPQLGIQREGEEEFCFYSLDELTRADASVFDPKAKMNLRLLTAKEDEEGFERLRRFVREKIPKFREEGELELPPPERIDNEILLEIHSTVDKLIARVIAKIALNYAAKHISARFALNDCNDPIRRFIRYDEGGNDWREFVRIYGRPLIAQETAELKITQGHVIQMCWGNRPDALLVRVSPYNNIAYEVMLTNNYRGPWFPLAIGHVFDWEHRVIHKLHGMSGIIQPATDLRLAANVYGQMMGKPKRPGRAPG